MREPAARLLVAEVDRHRDAAHVGDLQIEHDEIGFVVAHRGPHRLARGSPRRPAGRARRTPCAPDCAPIRRRRRRGSWSRRGEVTRGRSRADLGEGVEIVDVVREERHVRDRRRADPRGQVGEMAALAGRDLVEVGEVVVERREARAGVGFGAVRRRLAQLARPQPQALPRARIRTTGARGSRSARATLRPSLSSRCAKNSASSIASRRGEVTSTNAAPLSARSARTCSARSRKPASIPSNARKNATMSSTTSEPTTRDTVRRNVCTATLATLQVRARRHHQQPEDAVVEHAQQPVGRVEEVERVTGRRSVDDDDLVAAVLVQLVELLHRHVFLRARERARHVAVEAVVEDAFGLFLADRVARDESVERRLRVEHQRREPAARGRGAVGIPQLARHLARRVGERVEPERVGEPLRRVDRHDDRVAARAARLPARSPRPSSSCRRRRCRSRSRSCRARRARRAARVAHRRGGARRIAHDAAGSSSMPADSTSAR